MRSIGEPLVRADRAVETLAADQVLVRVAGCGVCHTDLGYLYDGVKTRHPLPLTLGHEISGTVEQAGANASAWLGKQVVVPAVIPCGSCALCAAGRGSICKQQIFPGNDVHGGFASHVVVPAVGLCEVDPAALARSGLQLADLSVLGDAITTPYQSIIRSGLQAGDVAIFIGVGGVGGFGVQLAAALGAHCIALDIDDARLQRLAERGAEHLINVRDKDAKEVRNLVRGFVKERGYPDTCWKIFECSGTGPGQSLAFSLLTFGAYLGVVGFTMATVDVRLSNLMAFDAQAQGNWGCLPEHYPAVLELVLSGKVEIGSFLERRPMSKINETFEDLRAHRMTLRPVLIPDF